MTSRSRELGRAHVHLACIIQLQAAPTLRPQCGSLHPVDWNDADEPRAKLEPRRGERAVLRACIDAAGTQVVVYCAHLEVFCGALARMQHLADIFNDARSQIDKVGAVPVGILMVVEARPRAPKCCGLIRPHHVEHLPLSRSARAGGPHGL